MGDGKALRVYTSLPIEETAGPQDLTGLSFRGAGRSDPKWGREHSGVRSAETRTLYPAERGPLRKSGGAWGTKMLRRIRGVGTRAGAAGVSDRSGSSARSPRRPGAPVPPRPAAPGPDRQR